MFKVGQKVICIESTPEQTDVLWEQVVEGEIYTVSRVYAPEGIPTVELYEVFAPEDLLFHAGFEARNFRPIVSTYKKLARQKIIQKLLSDSLKQPVEAL